jgi:hypothetical protein
MHILALVLMGLAVLAAFVLGSRAVGFGGVVGAKLFIWVWLASSLVNAAAGVFYAKIALLNEFAAFIPIFGIPAIAAWFVARQFSNAR